MYQARRRPLLVKGAFTPGRVRDASDISDEWYKNEASLPAFVFRSIFRDLLARGWDDPQGVPTSDFDRFVDDVLPRLNDVLDGLPVVPVGTLDALALAYHSSI